jgi:hypothetical protein
MIFPNALSGSYVTQKLNMLPCDSRSYESNGCFRDAKTLGALFVGVVRGFDVLYHALSETCVAVSNALRFVVFSGTSFSGHVVKILGLASQSKMIRPDAQRVVADVHDAGAVIAGSVCNRTVSQFPREAVSKATNTVDVDLTVAVSSRSGPVPALIGSVNFGPEPFFEGKIPSSHVTSIGHAVRSAVTVISRPRFAYFTPPREAFV